MLLKFPTHNDELFQFIGSIYKLTPEQFLETIEKIELSYEQRWGYRYTLPGTPYSIRISTPLFTKTLTILLDKLKSLDTKYSNQVLIALTQLRDKLVDLEIKNREQNQQFNGYIKGCDLGELQFKKTQHVTENLSTIVNELFPIIGDGQFGYWHQKYRVFTREEFKTYIIDNIVTAAFNKHHGLQKEQMKQSGDYKNDEVNQVLSFLSKPHLPLGKQAAKP